jgi:Domain of unknown function (DUF6285)
LTQDRPDAAELLEALAEFLYAEVRGWAPREKRFQALVAANVCAVVARELRAGEGPLREDLALFGELLGGELDAPTGDELHTAVRLGERRLAEEIRRGAFDARLDQLISGLREHVRRKLDIARPGYAGE